MTAAQMLMSDKGGENMNTQKLTRLALLTGTALILFAVEMQLPYPFPIPGIKPGLANIITVYAVYRYRAEETAMVVFARIILASVFCGNISSLLYSVSGSMLCLAGMIPLKKFLDADHIWFGSVIGAVLHNAGQLIAAFFLMGSSVLVYFPFLFLSGCLAGGFTGLCAQLIVKYLGRFYG